MGVIKKVCQLAATVLFFSTIGASVEATSTPIDLRTWTQEGNSFDGNWIVSDDGASVLQTINGNPTFFISPNELIDATIKGNFRVKPEGKIDDDFVGFVFGYQGPLSVNGDDAYDFDFLLFDWKQATQRFMGYTAQEGFSLSRVNGTITNQPLSFWQHTDSPEFDVLATDYGDGKRWLNNVEYEFALTYKTNQIKIAIDGQTIFDVSGDFQPGRFGFYNYSQPAVLYSSFTTTPITSNPDNEIPIKKTPSPEPEVSSIPEPTSPLSLLGLVAFCTGWQLFRHKRGQSPRQTSSQE